MSALDMTFKNESFDIIIMSDVLEHIPNTEKLFEEVFRVLKK
jgi:ubiquinone/menaquinone biosynthesis C-methylase UbiE